MRRRVAVLGGGNGGRTAAAEFAIGGHDVVLYEIPDHVAALEPILEAGYIRAIGKVEGTGPVRVEKDLARAIEGADAIFIVVPTNHHRRFAQMLGPVLSDGDLVVLRPGSFGSLDFSQSLRDQAVTADVTVAEMAALPYATRITSPLEVTVHGRRGIISVGVFPSDRTDRVAPIMEDLYPGIEVMPNVIAAGLGNPNPTLHCLGVLLSASRIEYSRGDFFYYEEGMTPHVCHAIEAIDNERLAIGHAFDIDVLSLVDTYPAMGYGPAGGTFYEVIRGVDLLRGIRGPSEVDSRYLTEDVPIGLTIYSQLGRAVGLAPVLMESVLHITKALLGTDFGDEPRTLERCGIQGLDRNGILEYVTTGHRPG
jgi:opine dehydrogenase